MIVSREITLTHKVTYLLKNKIFIVCFFSFCKILNIQAMQNSAREAEKFKWQVITNTAASQIDFLRENKLIYALELSLNEYKNINLVNPQKKSTKLDANLPGQLHVTVVIDVFRAFTTASYVLGCNPTAYIITTKSAVISRLALNFQNPLLIGKAEIGAKLAYDIPNSPTRAEEVAITGRAVLHRTEAGARGIFLARESDIILVAGFVNAEATAEYIRKLDNPNITLIPMGHEAITPSLEDHVCAMYIAALINEKKVNIENFIPILRKGPGRYFFSEDQWQYPHEDFKRCLETGRYRFAIQAIVKNDYAILTRCEQNS